MHSMMTSCVCVHIYLYLAYVMPRPIPSLCFLATLGMVLGMRPYMHKRCPTSKRTQQRNGCGSRGEALSCIYIYIYIDNGRDIPQRI